MMRLGVVLCALAAPTQAAAPTAGNVDVQAMVQDSRDRSAAYRHMNRGMVESQLKATNLAQMGMNVASDIDRAHAAISSLMQNKVESTPDSRKKLIKLEMQIQSDADRFEAMLKMSMSEIANMIGAHVNQLKRRMSAAGSDVRFKMEQAQQLNDSYWDDRTTLEKAIKDESRNLAKLHTSTAESQFTSSFLFNKTFSGQFRVMKTEMTDLLTLVKRFKEYALKRHVGYQDLLDDDIQILLKEIANERELTNAEVAAENDREDNRFDGAAAQLDLLMSNAKRTVENMGMVYDNINSNSEDGLDKIAKLAVDRTTFMNGKNAALYAQRLGLFNDIDSQINGKTEGLLKEIDDEYDTLYGAMDVASEAIEKTITDESQRFFRGTDNSVDWLYKRTDEYLDEVSKDDMTTNTNNQVLGEKLEAQREHFNFMKKGVDGDINAARSQAFNMAKTVNTLLEAASSDLRGKAKGDLQSEMIGASTELAKTTSEAADRVQGQLDTLTAEAKSVKGRMAQRLEGSTYDSGGGVLANNGDGQITAVDNLAARQSQMNAQLRDGELEADSLNARMLADQKTWGAKIDASNARIRGAIKNRESQINNGMEPFLHAANDVADEADRQVSSLPGVLTDAERTLTKTQNQFDLDEADVNADVKKRKSELGNWLKGTLGATQGAVNKAGTLVNDILPALKTYAGTNAKSLYVQLDGLEQNMKLATKSAVIASANADLKDGAAFTQDAASLAQRVAAELASTGERHKQSIELMENSLTDTKSAIQQSNAQLQTKANQVKAYAGQVNTEIAEQAAELGDEIKVAEQKTATTSAEGMKTMDQMLSTSNTKVQNEIMIAEQKAKSDIISFEGIVKSDADQKKKSVVDRTKAAFGATEKASTDSEKYYKAQTKEAKEKLRVMMAHMRGEQADETEWGDNLKEVIAGAAADAHSEAILGAQTRLEQEAAINTRFREISSAIQGNVHELDENKQKMMEKLNKAAQDEFKRVVNSGEFTKEELKERMAKVEAHLVGQLRDVMDSTTAAEGGFEDATEAAEAFDKEAAQRLASFHTKMEAEDQAIGVVLPARGKLDSSVEQTHMALEDVITAAAAEVDHTVASNTARVEQIKMQHELDGKRLQSEVLADIQTLESTLNEATRACDEALGRLDESAKKPAEQAAQTNADMLSFLHQVDETQQVLSTRLGEQEVNRKRRLDFLQDWQQGTQKMAAESMERMVQVMTQLLVNSKKRYEQDKAKTKMFSQQLASQMESEEVQVLQMIGGADKMVDGILGRDKDMASWAKVYEEGTYQFRREVAQKMGSLSDNLSDELGLIANASEDFQFNLDHYANTAKGEADNEIKGAMQANAHLMSQAEKDEGMEYDGLKEMFSKNAQEAYDSAEDLSKDVAASDNTIMGREGDLEGASSDITSGVASTKEEAIEAARELQKAMQVKADKVEAEKQILKERLDTLDAEAAGHVPSTFSELRGSATRGELRGFATQDATAATLEENIELNAEHEKLKQRLVELEARASRA